MFILRSLYSVFVTLFVELTYIVQANIGNHRNNRSLLVGLVFSSLCLMPVHIFWMVNKASKILRVEVGW
jgi:hypothetical protein